MFAGCGGSIPPPTSSKADLPNIPQIETAIANSVLARAQVRAKVLCPAVVPEIKGETFSCVALATKPKPRTFSFLVTEHGGTYVTYAQTG